MEVPTLTIACHEGRQPADAIFAYSSGCPQPSRDHAMVVIAHGSFRGAGHEYFFS
jgi:hypothetical protein